MFTPCLAILDPGLLDIFPDLADIDPIYGVFKKAIGMMRIPIV